MTHEKIAEDFIYPLWRCVDSDFKQKYKGDTWPMFENFLKSAACTENLRAFFDQFKRLCPFNWQHKYEKQIIEVLQSGDDDAILQAIRTEGSYLVLLTRALNTDAKTLFDNANTHS